MKNKISKRSNRNPQDIAITFEKVSKRFKKGQKLLLKEALLDVFKPGSLEYFWALKDVSFEMKKGETLGIIGPNGSGKSTMLKLIAGVMFPNRGKVEVKGRIAPLIELGAGFHPELTGRDNIYLNGVILGLSIAEIENIFTEIVEFAGLAEFIDTPVKHYSSGMYMRLGFSIAIHTKPDILLVDEILSVGDTSFQKKSYNSMENFKRNGTTIVYVTHSMEQVNRFCSRAILLDKGEVVSDGLPADVIKQYSKIIH